MRTGTKGEYITNQWRSLLFTSLLLYKNVTLLPNFLAFQTKSGICFVMENFQNFKSTMPIPENEIKIIYMNSEIFFK